MLHFFELGKPPLGRPKSCAQGSWKCGFNVNCQELVIGRWKICRRFLHRNSLALEVCLAPTSHSNTELPTAALVAYELSDYNCYVRMMSNCLDLISSETRLPAGHLGRKSLRFNEKGWREYAARIVSRLVFNHYQIVRAFSHKPSSQGSNMRYGLNAN